MSVSGNGSPPYVTARQLRSAQAYPGSTMQTTYDTWVKHARRCTSCVASGTAEHGCPTGRSLWDDYRSARIDASTDGGTR
ncbi:hypothetical protein [Streptomyces sp. CBMA29]|uniref:hypothetical protein n=1 Tax=Streptomyces sp. CBMA29 TaxID=1896314 RepID=UPI001661CF20|nr:hypothetical protein [Streptomyces sp. CBMA29]